MFKKYVQKARKRYMELRNGYREDCIYESNNGLIGQIVHRVYNDGTDTYHAYPQKGQGFSDFDTAFRLTGPFDAAIANFGDTAIELDGILDSIGVPLDDRLLRQIAFSNQEITLEPATKDPSRIKRLPVDEAFYRLSKQSRTGNGYSNR